MFDTICYVLAFLAIFALVPCAISWAWGIVMVPIFGLPALSWLQSLALFILSSFLIRPVYPKIKDE